MFGWVEAVIVGVFSCTIIIIIIVLLIRRHFASKQSIILTEHDRRQQQQPSREANTTTVEFETKRRPSYYHIFGRGSSTKTSFNWSDHPSLITEAVENGWSRFAFTSLTIKTSLFNSVRSTGEYFNNPVEESWEIGSGSVDFMQKLHFRKKGRKYVGSPDSMNYYSTVRMSLPLPGPPVVKSFPEEAYFEINVLSSSEDNNNNGGEGEKTKLLIQQSNSCSASSKESLFHVSSISGSQLLEELKMGKKNGGVKMSIGLSVGGIVTTRLPGTYPGSIAFNSDGSVFLGGMKLVFESGKEDEVKTGKVIGCGFDPRKKKVYFTVDSELVHEINCKSEEFGMPLYPVLATNIDISVLVNLGQSKFSYPPANSYRTPNPCFICPVANSSPTAFRYEDSKELFSMGRIDAEWLSHSATTKSTVSNSSDHYYNEEEEVPEAELFEIVLDSTGR